jgi:hypothetical protein
MRRDLAKSVHCISLKPGTKSVIGSMLHDVKTLTAKIRPHDERMYNSPWNSAEVNELIAGIFAFKPGGIGSF